MNERDGFDRILASLHDAALDNAYWSATSALIDDVCRTKGNSLVHGDGCSQHDIEIFFWWLFSRGEHQEQILQLYVDRYYRFDERIPRIRRLPDSQLVHIRDLYTDQEIKTSSAYNEALPLSDRQNSLNARMDGPCGSRIVWTIGDPIDSGGWSSAQVDLIGRLLPHLRQFVCVRQALVDAGALGTSLVGILDNTRSGVIQLDRRGRIVAANGRASGLLRQGDGLFDRGGFLRARLPADDVDLQKLLARSLPRFGGQGVSGSMTVRRPDVLPRLVVHISPVGGGQMDFRPLRVAALALIVDPGSQECGIDPAMVSGAFGLTAAESQVAVQLAEGKSIGDIAVATGRRESTIRWHVKQIFNKHGITRQVELVRLVLSLAAVP